MSMSGTATNIAPIQRVTLSLYNVDCASDAQTVERILKQIPGVATVYANPASEKVYIEYDGAQTDPTGLRAALDEAGFGQKGLQVTCGRCRHLPGERTVVPPKPRWAPRWWSLWR